MDHLITLGGTLVTLRRPEKGPGVVEKWSVPEFGSLVVNVSGRGIFRAKRGKGCVGQLFFKDTKQKKEKKNNPTHQTTHTNEQTKQKKKKKQKTDRKKPKTRKSPHNPNQQNTPHPPTKNPKKTKTNTHTRKPQQTTKLIHTFVDRITPEG